LVGAVVIEPRSGRFDESGIELPMPGHSSVLQLLGTFILWLGWYGFNMGSTLGLSPEKARQASRILITTTLAATSGGMTTVIQERIQGYRKVWDVNAMCNGILVGLVSITAGCATLMPWAAIIAGFGGGVVYRYTSRALLYCRVDDPLDAFAVHGAGGMWGLLVCAFLSHPEYTHAVANLSEGGIMYGGAKLLGAAMLFMLAQIAWVGSTSLLIFITLKKLKLLRVPLLFDGEGGAVRVEDAYSTHGGEAYSPTAGRRARMKNDHGPGPPSGVTDSSGVTTAQA